LNRSIQKSLYSKLEKNSAGAISNVLCFNDDLTEALAIVIAIDSGLLLPRDLFNI